MASSRFATTVGRGGPTSFSRRLLVYLHGTRTRTHHPSPTVIVTRILSPPCTNDPLFGMVHPCGGRRSFSTRPHHKIDKFVDCPPNLKIDPRSTASPFYGMERVDKKNKKIYGKTPTAEAAAATTEEVEEERPDVEEVVEETDEEGEIYEEEEDEDDDETIEWYDPNTRPEPYYAIPLPERLHVPIVTLQQNEEVGTIHLASDVFGLDPIRTDLLHRCVVYLRNKKRGRRKAITKTISEVRGSGRKVRQQKGMGMARAGHRRPPHWRGGAKAHGPKGYIQNYGNVKLNKKVKRLALRHALSQKLKEGNLIVVNDMALDSHKTKGLVSAMEQFDVAGRYGTTAFMVDDAKDDNDDEEEEVLSLGGINVNLSVASGNVYKVKVSNQFGANVYDILKYEKLFLSLAAVTALEGRLSGRA